MSLTFNTSGANKDDSGTAITTLDVALTGIGSGNAVAAWCKHEGADTTISMATSAGTDSFTMQTKVAHANGDLRGGWGALLGATVTGNVTYRLTLGAARAYVRFLIAVFNVDSGDTLSVEAHNIGSGTTPTNSVASGNISPTGDDLVVLGSFGEYTGSAPTDFTINGAAAGGTVSDANYGRIWYSILTAGFTNGNAAASGYANAAWLCNVMAIKSTAAAGSSPVAKQKIINQSIHRSNYW